jgi:hypothetical protein
LRQYAASLKVAVLIPVEVIEFSMDPFLRTAQQKRVPEIFLLVKGARPAHKDDNITAIYELIV